MDEIVKNDICGKLNGVQQIGKKLGRAFWFGNDLQKILGYANKEDFDYLVAKAKMECEKIDADPKSHFVSLSRIISPPAGKMTEMEDWALSRLACFFTVRNAVRSNESVIMENYFLGSNKTVEQFLEDKERMIIRPRIAEHHKLLSRADSRMGVDRRIEHALLGQETTIGLYEMDAPELKEYRNLGDENLYDHMAKNELAINDEVIIDTNNHLREYKPFSGFNSARAVHRETAQDMRNDIKLRRYRGGVLPELLPVALKTPRQLAAEEKKAIKELTKQ
jgi:DNA-damage-inducible protein D